MLPRQSSNSSSGERDIPIEEIVFSCGICQATVSELYADKDKVQGLSSSEDESGIVPKLWIAECSHVFCGRHLEGGGAPFHSKHEPPKAHCPVCVSEKKRGYEAKKGLYAIRGLGKGEYDEAVPEAYLRVPPVKLDASDPDMDAMRFQYSHLVHYAKQVTKSWKIAEKKRRAMEHTLSKERKQWRRQETDLNERMAITEGKLKKWEARKPMIDHYLGKAVRMEEDIKTMRSQLLELGYEVPKSQYAIGEQARQSEKAPLPKKNESSATIASSSSRKRKHLTSHGDYADEEGDNEKENHSQSQRRESRELMPPPLRTFRPQQLPPTSSHQRNHVQPPVQVYEDDRRNGAQADIQMQDKYNAMPGSHPRYGSHYDHGALPIRSTQAEVYQGDRQHHQPAMEYEHHGSQGIPYSSVEPGQRSGFLSMPPRRRSQQYMHSQDGDMDDIQPSMSQAQLPLRTDSGLIARQPELRTQSALYNPPTSSSRHPPPPSQLSNTPSMRRPLQPVPAPSASPFFASRAAPDPMQQPSARGSMLQHNFHIPSTRDGTRGRQYGSLARPPAQSSSHAMSMPPPSFGSQSQGRSNYPPSQHRYAANSYHREPAYSSQAPVMSDGLFQRPNTREPPTASQPMSDIHGGRLTLPPSRSRGPFLGSQDSRLSMIPGARGGAPPQHMYGRQSLASAHSTSRYLPSSRRPIQR